MMRALLAACLLGAPLAAGVPSAAAHGVKIVVRGSPTVVTSSKTVVTSTTVVVPPAAAPRTFVRESVFSPRFIPDAPVTHRHHHPHAIFVAPAPRCVQFPGSWTYVWVPQTSVSNVWVAGHWSPEGTWVAGHYAPYAVTTGQYQPVWVPGRIAC
jgi:hypothetical protein